MGKIPVKISGGEFTPFIGMKKLDLVTGVFLHHGMPLLEAGECLCFGGKKIYPSIAAVVINEKHKLTKAAKRGILLGTVDIRMINC